MNYVGATTMLVSSLPTPELVRALTLSLSILAAAVGLSGNASGQAYTYDPPVCGAAYREEPHKPQQLRVTWEMSAAQLCVQQSKFPAACRHLQAGLAAADRMGPEAGMTVEKEAGGRVFSPHGGRWRQ